MQEQLNSIYINNILTSTFAFYDLAHHAEILAILPEFEGSVAMFDVDKIPIIVTQCERATQAQLKHLRRLLSNG